jgi:hypothetical protein
LCNVDFPSRRLNIEEISTVDLGTFDLLPRLWRPLQGEHIAHATTGITIAFECPRVNDLSAFLYYWGQRDERARWRDADLLVELPDGSFKHLFAWLKLTLGN